MFSRFGNHCPVVGGYQFIHLRLATPKQSGGEVT